MKIDLLSSIIILKFIQKRIPAIQCFEEAQSNVENDSKNSYTVSNLQRLKKELNKKVEQLNRMEEKEFLVTHHCKIKVYELEDLKNRLSNDLDFQKLKEENFRFKLSYQNLKVKNKRVKKILDSSKQERRADTKSVEPGRHNVLREELVEPQKIDEINLEIKCLTEVRDGKLDELDAKEWDDKERNYMLETLEKRAQDMEKKLAKIEQEKLAKQAHLNVCPAQELALEQQIAAYQKCVDQMRNLTVAQLSTINYWESKVWKALDKYEKEEHKSIALSKQFALTLENLDEDKHYFREQSFNQCLNLEQAKNLLKRKEHFLAN